MKKVYAYIHTHWDREWYREFEEFRVRLIEVFDDVLQKLKTGELDYFYFDGQTAALEDFLEIYPERKCEVEKLIAQKKYRRLIKRLPVGGSANVTKCLKP